MAGRGDHVDLAEPGAVRDTGAQRAEPGARRDDLRENARGQAELLQQAGGPIARERIEALRGGGDGELGDSRAAERPMDEIGHEEQAIGCVEQFRRVLLGSQQLEQRIELHELQAGPSEDLRARHLLEGPLHHPVGAGVTVRVRLSQHFIPPVEQHVVHAPCIRAHRDNRLAVLLRGASQAILDFGPEPQDVPAERIAQADRAVREPVDFFEADGSAVPEAGHYAATFGAEVNGKIDARHG